jgi:hypothetical protein
MGKYIRYLAADQMQIALTVDLLRWSKHRHTPLWLELAVEPGNALRGLAPEQPPRVFYDGHQGRPIIALPLKLHVEESAVVDDLLGQVLEIVDLVRDCPRTVPVQDSDAPPLAPEVAQ